MPTPNTFVQTSISDRNREGLPGDLVDSRKTQIVTAIAAGPMNAGLMTFFAPGETRGAAGPAGTSFDPGHVYQAPSPAAAAAATAILASGGVSSASPQTITSFNGAFGATEMRPGRRVTMVLSNNANWTGGNAVITYVDAATGANRSETLAIPSSGNTTLTTTGYASRVLSLAIPAQGGGAGTYTLGVAALDASVTANDFAGILLRKPMTVMFSALYDYADGDTVAITRKLSSVHVVSETAVTQGDDVFVRVAGTGTFGAFRNDSDSGNAVQIVGARFGRTAAANALTSVELP